MGFVFYRQLDAMSCGPTCLKMVAKYYGRRFDISKLSQLCGFNREGVSILGLSEAAKQIQLQPEAVRLDIISLEGSTLPCILHWREGHFVVLIKIRSNRFYIADPAEGIIQLSREEFSKSWLSNNTSFGVALLLAPSSDFFSQKDDPVARLVSSSLTKLLFKYRSLFFQLLLALGLGSLLQLFIPFLTQSVVDTGIHSGDIKLIYLIVAAQAMLVFGRVTVDIVRSWILLHISTRINISLLTEFLIKLMKLPMSFFETKMVGDIMQRMDDQRRIETFLTGSALNSLFSVINLALFGFILACYNSKIFIVFFCGSVLYLAWILAFNGRRKLMNYRNFEIGSKNQSTIIQLINGMQEIKLNNCERKKRWEWERLQARQFKTNLQNLALNQYQQAGATLINEAINLSITFLSAKSVIDGQLTVGAMLALQYIVGQVNSPILQLVGFTQTFQDAKISFERMNDIQSLQDEESDNGTELALPADRSIFINNLTFCYPGSEGFPVLDDITLHIPEGKTTAIVGASGSGKTTLLKLLLRFYSVEAGQISIGGKQISEFSYEFWRNNCGSVMQDGFLFSDSLEGNIAVGDDKPDPGRLGLSLKIANLTDFVDGLPKGLNTQIGADGSGLSQGQKQRILIARAVYKDPFYLFLDEATNALDATNELNIMREFQQFLQGRTVIIVAHRLSTVSNADNIIVLKNGKVIEQGSHAELTAFQGNYYHLVKNQLELGV